jgi:hypothetical protein
MGALLKFVIICFCVYWLLKWIIRPVLRIAFQKVVHDAVNKDRQYQSYNHKKGKSEGQISVEYIPPQYKQGKSGNDDGEYVDYEEVK